MTKQHRRTTDRDARSTVSVRLSADDDDRLEDICATEGAKKGDLAGRLIRWYVDLPDEARGIVLQRPTLLSARYFAAMLRELADTIESRSKARPEDCKARPEDGQEIKPAAEPGNRK